MLYFPQCRAPRVHVPPRRGRQGLRTPHSGGNRVSEVHISDVGQENPRCSRVHATDPHGGAAPPMPTPPASGWAWHLYVWARLGTAWQVSASRQLRAQQGYEASLSPTRFESGRRICKKGFEPRQVEACVPGVLAKPERKSRHVLTLMNEHVFRNCSS